jgi:hypothetical protein
MCHIAIDILPAELVLSAKINDARCKQAAHDVFRATCRSGDATSFSWARAESACFSICLGDVFMTTPLRIILIVCVVAGAIRNSAAQDYEIQFDRARKPGDRYEFHATQTKREVTTITKEGKVQRETDREVTSDFKGVVTVEQVDRQGKPLKLSIVVESFTVSDQGKPLGKGDVLTAETIDDETRFTLDGKEVDPKLKGLLAELVKTKTSKSHADDQVFGSKERRRVGESWKINHEAAAKEMGMKPEVVSGSVKLEGVETHGGRECLKLAGTLVIRTFPNIAQMEKIGYVSRDPKMTATMSGLFPVDTTVPTLKETIVMTANGEFNGTNDLTRGTTMKFSVNNRLAREVRPVR